MIVEEMGEHAALLAERFGDRVDEWATVNEPINYLVASHGVQYLFATVVLMGVIQVLAGAFHLGKFIRLVPYPVMLGFVNGLAIVIFLAQFGQFQMDDGAGGRTWLPMPQLLLMLGLAVVTMIVIWAAGRWTKAVPAPLVGIVFTTALTLGLGLDVRDVGDMASIAGVRLPSCTTPVPNVMRSVAMATAPSGVSAS